MKKKTSKLHKPTVVVDSWYNCYPSDWKGKIVQESTAHPAKYSSRLIENIYDHLSEMGWVEAGDSVVDPFAGVGLGALHALRLGLNWTGIELENRWFELAFEKYPCNGFSKEFWKRFSHRPDIISFLRKTRWLCPVCESRLVPVAKLNKAGKLVERTVPFSDPHVYMGNIPSWNKRYAKLPKWGSASLFNGDSRALSQILKNFQTAAMQSPPFGNSVSGGGIAKEGYMPESGVADMVGARSYSPQVHGLQAGNLANLKISEEGFQVSLSSPPYADSINSPDSGIDWEKAGRPDRLKASSKRHGVQGIAPTHYGYGTGQLGSMKSKPENFDASIASPPFLQTSGGLTDPKDGGTIDKALHKRHSAGNKHADAYGENSSQLTNMPEGNLETVLSVESFDLSVASPPYASHDLPEANRDYSKLVEFLEGKHGRKMKRSRELFGAGDYGKADGQLGAMKEGDFDISLASPPYENSAANETIDSSSRRRLARASGQSNTENVSPIDSEKAGLRNQTYGATDGNMGNEQGENFWGAARVIVEQVYANLKPGGHAVWVVKDYVRNWEIVPFCDQWRRLCEAVGFVTLHEHHAQLSRHKGTNYLLEGGEHKHIKTSKGFFRRLREAKGSPAIDWETVYCMVKPEQ